MAPDAPPVVRDATPADAPEVAAVHVRSWQAAYRGLLPDDFLASLDPVARASRYRLGVDETDAPHTIVAVMGGGVVGFATTGPSRDADAGGLGELMALYVDPARWGTGTGRALIAAARDRLARIGFRAAALWVLAGNARAEAFYRRDGWIPDGAERDEELRPGWRSLGQAGGSPVLHEIRYRRDLA